MVNLIELMFLVLFLQCFRYIFSLIVFWGVATFRVSHLDKTIELQRQGEFALDKTFVLLGHYFTNSEDPD